MIEPLDVSSNSSDASTEYLVPAGYSWDDSWELTRDLIVQVKTSEEETVALTCLSLKEYGLGSNVESAVYDLLTSLSGYREVLEARKERLSGSALSELELLQGLTRRKGTVQRWT